MVLKLYDVEGFLVKLELFLVDIVGFEGVCFFGMWCIVFLENV